MSKAPAGCLSAPDWGKIVGLVAGGVAVDEGVQIRAPVFNQATDFNAGQVITAVHFHIARVCSVTRGTQRPVCARAARRAQEPGLRLEELIVFHNSRPCLGF